MCSLHIGMSDGVKIETPMPFIDFRLYDTTFVLSNSGLCLCLEYGASPTHCICHLALPNSTAGPVSFFFK